MGSDVTHCGEVGCRHVVKLINNTLVFEHTAALAEMLVVGERGGVAPETLLQAVAKGSGDSFVLRNHGMKAMVPRNFPDRAFPSERYYTGAVERGLGHKYFPVIAEIIEEQGR